MRQPTDREALSEGLLMRMRAHIVRCVRRADVEINRETGLVEIPTPDLGAPTMQATGTAVQRAHPLIVEITPGVFRWAEKKDTPRRTVIVGHVNPYTPAPAFALADVPHHSSGDRLRRALGLSRESWWGPDLDRLNIYRAGDPPETARVRARQIAEEAREGMHVLILLGREVWEAFEIERPRPYTVTDLPLPRCALKVGLLPHPSGRNRTKLDPAEVRRVCVDAGSPLPFGELP